MRKVYNKLKILVVSFLLFFVISFNLQSRANEGLNANDTQLSNTIEIGNSKIQTSDKSNNENHIRISDIFRKWDNENDNKIVKEKTDYLKIANERVLTPKSIALNYIGQSYQFLFWLGAAQLFHCYNDFGKNPVACFEMLMLEADGVHRFGLLIFVVASGLTSTSPWLFQKSYKFFKNERLTNAFISGMTLSVGMSSQNVVMHTLNYLLKNDNFNRCSKLAIYKERNSEQKHFGYDTSKDHITPENDPCRIAEDQNHWSYMKNNLPPEILSMVFTMPLHFALQTALGMAVSPQGFNLASSTYKILEKLSTIANGSSKFSSGLQFIIKLAPLTVASKAAKGFYNLSFEFKTNNIVFKALQYVFTPTAATAGSLYSINAGISLLLFVGLSEPVTKFVSEKYFENITSNFSDVNETLEKANVGSELYNENFCAESEVDTCEPKLSKLLSQINYDFAKWKEIKTQDFVMTYQGWMQKVQNVIRSLEATIGFTMQLVDGFINPEGSPWSKKTFLRGVFPLSREMIQDESVFLKDSHFYKNQIAERAFLIGMGIKAFLHSNNSEISYYDEREKAVKTKKIFELKQGNFACNLTTLGTPLNQSQDARSSFLSSYFKERGMESNKGEYSNKRRHKKKLINNSENQMSLQDFFNGWSNKEKNNKNKYSGKSTFKSFSDNKDFLKWMCTLNNFADTLTPGFLISFHDAYLDEIDDKQFYVKKVLMEHYKNHSIKNKNTGSYEFSLFNEGEIEENFSVNNPLRYFGVDKELLYYIDSVTSYYINEVLSKSNHLYMVNNNQLDGIQVGLNYFVENMESVIDHSIMKKKQTDSNLSQENSWYNNGIDFVKKYIKPVYEKSVYKINQNVLVQLFLDSMGVYTKNSSSIYDLKRILNTISIGLGDPFLAINEVHAYKERFKRFSLIGRNSELYHFPKEYKKIKVTNPFDSMLIGLICGVDNPDDSINKNMQYVVRDSSDVELEDLIPDEFKPFRIIEKTDEIEKFCESTIETESELNQQLEQIFTMITQSISKNILHIQDVTIVKPEFSKLLIGTYCDLKAGRDAHNSLDNSVVWHNEDRFSAWKTQWNKKLKKSDFIVGPWRKVEKKYCRNSIDSNADGRDLPDLSDEEIRDLYTASTQILEELKRRKLDYVENISIPDKKAFKDNIQAEHKEKLYQLTMEILSSSLSASVTRIYELVIQKYEAIYKNYLSVFLRTLVGGGQKQKELVINELKSNDIKQFCNLKETNNCRPLHVGVSFGKVSNNSFYQETIRHVLQESSYYLTILNQFLQSVANRQNSQASYKNKKFIDKQYIVHPSVIESNPHQKIFLDTLYRFNSVDQVTQLPQAYQIIWVLNSTVTKMMISLLNGESIEKSAEINGANNKDGLVNSINQNIQSDLVTLTSYLEYIYLNFSDLNELADHQRTEIAKISTKYRLKNEFEFSFTPTERAVLRTWFSHFRSLTSNIASFGKMVNPMDYNSLKQNLMSH